MARDFIVQYHMINETCTWCDFSLVEGRVLEDRPPRRPVRGLEWSGREDTVPFRQSGLESKGYCKRSTPMTEKKRTSLNWLLTYCGLAHVDRHLLILSPRKSKENQWTIQWQLADSWLYSLALWHSRLSCPIWIDKDRKSGQDVPIRKKRKEKGKGR